MGWSDHDGSHARVDGLVGSGWAVCSRAHSFRFGDDSTVRRRMSDPYLKREPQSGVYLFLCCARLLLNNVRFTPVTVRLR